MKACTTIFAILILGQLGFGQTAETNEDPYRSRHHTIGLNATGFLRQIITNDSNNLANPYLITYNWDMGTINLRAGLGPEFRTAEVVHDGFSDRQTHTLARVDGRIGVGFDIVEQGRWKVMSGADLVGGYAIDKHIDDTGFDKITNQTEDWNVGVGPFIQITFFITPRISLATEAAGYFRRFESSTTELFENFPDFNDEISSTAGTELDLILPTSLFIQFHF